MIEIAEIEILGSKLKLKAELLKFVLWKAFDLNTSQSFVGMQHKYCKKASESNKENFLFSVDFTNDSL